MRAWLWILVLVAGCLTDTEPVTPCDTSAECPAEQPYCDPAIHGCAVCTESSHCASRLQNPLCDTESGRCVECFEHEDCTSASAAQCSTLSTCIPCVTNAHCAGVEGKDVCDDGVCVERCTIATEAAVCGDFSCDPATEACTETERGSVNVCRPCVADSECGDGTGSESDDFRCIELSFDGASQGGRCLQRSALTCARPYGTVVVAESLSGALEEGYCAIREDLTTCEAVVAGVGGVECPSENASECASEGALCEMIGAVPNLCTYPCEFDTECPEGKPACLDDFCTVPPP